MNLVLLDPDFSVCQLPAPLASEIPGAFYFYAKTDDEISLVCETPYVPQNATKAEHGWKAIKIAATMDFALVGILAGIAGVLAQAGIAIFAVSTYNTDYILVKADACDAAVNQLAKNGHQFIPQQTLPGPADAPIAMEATLHPLGEKQSYIFVTAISRYGGKLLLSRHSQRTTWETQGGHIEPGETPLQAMKRELYEEAGALDFTVKPICDYSAAGTHGIFFFADIKALGPLPQSEMAEVRCFDALPTALTYPGITPALFAAVAQYFETP